jgi:hypothetical protein
MAKYCGGCGEPLVEGKRFCPNCGVDSASPDAQAGHGTPGPAGPSDGPAIPGGAGPAHPTVLAKLVGIVLGLAMVVTVWGYVSGEDPQAARFLDKVTQKIDSIVTPKPPIGDLTPTRGLEGTWKSSLSGKGFQLYGRFKNGAGTVSVYEDGDMELVIDSVSGNTATGKMRVTDLGVSTRATIPGKTVSTPRRVAVSDSGYGPMAIRVSGPSLDFGSFSSGGVSGSMQGSYTTDLMSGTMSVQSQYGPIKGEFHLIRRK